MSSMSNGGGICTSNDQQLQTAVDVRRKLHHRTDSGDLAFVTAPQPNSPTRIYREDHEDVDVPPPQMIMACGRIDDTVVARDHIKDTVRLLFCSVSFGGNTHTVQQNQPLFSYFFAFARCPGHKKNCGCHGLASFGRNQVSQTFKYRQKKSKRQPPQLHEEKNVVDDN